MKTLLFLASMAAYGQSVINAPAVNLDINGNSAVLLWMSTQGTGKATTVPGSITAIATTITVASAADFVTPNVIAIGAEHINVASKAGNVLTVTRGYNGTTAAIHAAAAPVTEMKYKTLNNLGKQIIVDTLKQIVRQSTIVTDPVTAAQTTAGTTTETAVQ